MRISTSAARDLELAAAIGRFSQACSYLEQQLVFVLTRLLPLTIDMGTVLFSKNLMRRNVMILEGLCELPEVTIDDTTRTKLKSLLSRLHTINNDRNRFLHCTIIGGDFDQPLMLIEPKDNGKGTFTMPISIELINERTVEAERLWTELYINPTTYDLSSWTMSPPRHTVKEYPKV